MDSNPFAEARNRRKYILDVKRNRLVWFYHKDIHTAARYHRRIVLATKRLNMSSNSSTNRASKLDTVNRMNSCSICKKRNFSEVVKSTESWYQRKRQFHGNHIGTNEDENSFKNTTEYDDFGDPDRTCEFCHALMWYEERCRGDRKSVNPKFSLCCMKGKVQLPILKEPPKLLKDLFLNTDSKSKIFLENIRRYNMMFSFTSMGARIDNSVNNGKGPYVFKISGQNYHRIGSLLPRMDSIPKFSQLYIYDTQNEINNRITAFRSGSSNTVSDDLDPMLVTSLKNVIDDNNQLAKSFRMARDVIDSNKDDNIRLKLIGTREKDGRQYNMPESAEIAALIIGDGSIESDFRDIIIQYKSGELKRINELHPSYMALQYPLLFPYGEDGYHLGITLKDKPNIEVDSEKKNRIRLSMREWFAYRLQERDNEFSSILLSRKLLQQFVVDGYSMVESERLSYVKNNQDNLRCETYHNIVKESVTGENQGSNIGKRVILPSSFTGGSRYMMQNYLDAMALCRVYGHPDLFLTFTCNSKWPEITRYCEKRGLKPEDRLDIVTRVFNMKMESFIKDLKDKKIFGKVVAVEYQKRGLPHVHVCLFLHPDDKIKTADQIDSIISAEIPDKYQDSEYYELVKEFMVHGPCGIDRPRSPCMVEKKCSKHFPKKFIEETSFDSNGYATYKRPNNGRVVNKNGIDLDNRFIVPHNKYLLKKFRAHINIEWCNQSRSIKYLFKYLNKGPDRTAIRVLNAPDFSNSNHDSEVLDEIKKYYDCRFLSACEATWRLFQFPIHYRTPSVERLPFHLPGHQIITYEGDDSLDFVISKASRNVSKFLGWMECNQKYQEAKNLTYVEFPSKFVWHHDVREWLPRKKGYSIGRIHHVTPSAGETYYLRILLNIVKGPTCYNDILTVENVKYNSYKDACFAMGLLEDDKEYIEGIIETSFSGSASYCRNLFAMLLLAGVLTKPETVWSATWNYLCEDIDERFSFIYNDTGVFNFSDQEKQKLALADVDRILRRNGSTLKNFKSLPFPEEFADEADYNSFIHDELQYDIRKEQTEHDDLFNRLTEEQKAVYDKVMNAVNAAEGGFFFLYGYGGTGKTYVWKTLSTAIRAKGDIVLNVASSGIASLLLTGGRTAHSRFLIPIVINEDSICSIKPNSELAALLKKAKLIIWDEAPMIHRHCFEALDRSLRDILKDVNPKSLEKPFGGKVVVLGGDFRQILPVIQKGTRHDIVNAAINSSYLWNHCQLLRLTINMRLRQGITDTNLEEVQNFSAWVLNIGEGNIPENNDGVAEIEIPTDLLIHHSGDPIESIVSCIYPSLSTYIGDVKYFQERAILAPTNDEVDSINDYLISLIDGEDFVYLSSDNIDTTEGRVNQNNDLITPEFLNSIKCSGVPNHKIRLKIGVPIMLLRNIDQRAGLCNGTRLVVSKLRKHIIQAKVMTGINAGQEVFIPRLNISPSDLRYPFKLKRRQFPISICFAMTINKSQGQSLSKVGLFLTRPVFSHGQLYVAMSRVTSRQGLKILISNSLGQSSNKTTNVVYKEVLQDL